MVVELTVRIPAALAELARGQRNFTVEVAAGAGGGATLRAVLDVIANTHPALGRRVRDELGAVRTHVNVFVGDDNSKDLDGLETEVHQGTEVTIIPAISGGAPSAPFPF